jgi:hypothetical protein
VFSLNREKGICSKKKPLLIEQEEVHHATKTRTANTVISFSQFLVALLAATVSLVPSARTLTQQPIQTDDQAQSTVKAIAPVPLDLRDK